MNSRLAWIAVVALGISLACWSVAGLSAAMGWVDDGPSWLITRSCIPLLRTRHDGETGSADLGWQGSDVVGVNIPAHIYYQPGPNAQASVSGNSELVGHVRMRGGVIGWDSSINCASDDNLVVRLTGPAVKAWVLNGSGKLELSDIKQDVLRISMRGSGTVAGSGETNQTSVDVAGSGGVDLSKLVTKRADARIRGSADIELTPRDDADIDIAGSATVTVHGSGARVTSRVAGSGQIKQVP